MNHTRRDLLKTAGVTAGVVAIAGCMGGDDDAAEGVTDEELEDLPEESITLAHHLEPDPTGHPHRAALMFQSLMERWTNEQFEVDVAAGGSLGTDGEVLEQIIDGTLEMGTGHAEGVLSTFYPNANIIGVPFFFDTIDEANYVFDQEFGSRFFEDVRNETGVNILSFWDNGGFRTFTTTDTPIESIDDFAGLTIRTQEIEPHQVMVQELGATPQAISGAELYQALDQGVVDGQENSIPTMIASLRYEVQDYFIMTEHLYSHNYLLAGDAWYNGLDATYQHLVAQAATRASIEARRINRIAREDGVEYLEEQGIEFIVPDEETMNEYREATQDPVENAVRDDLEDESWLDDLYDARDQAREELEYPAHG